MELVQLYEKQIALDKIIEDKIKEVDPAFEMFSVKNLDKKIFAFKVELGELANEVGFFKYWKHSHVIDRSKTLEEWADCLHFLLSIGIGKDYAKYAQEAKSSVKPIEHLETAEFLFYGLMGVTLKSSTSFATAVSLLVTIGHALGFNEDQLLEAYLKKNEKNIDRQKGGY